MSTSTERPPESTRTPQETPAAIARAIVTLSMAPTESFRAFFNTDERCTQYEQLVDCLTAERLSDDVPILWSKTKRHDVDARLRASLSTDEDRVLLDQLDDHNSDAGSIREDAAFLVGVAAGRCTSGVTSEPVSAPPTDEPASGVLRDANGRVVPFTSEELLEARRPTLEDVLTEAIGALRLAEAMSWLKAAGVGDYTVPVEAASVLALPAAQPAPDVIERHVPAIPVRERLMLEQDAR